MDGREAAARRMHAVGLWGAPDARDAADVVRRLGAVQAQDYGPAKWSLGRRMAGAPTDADLDRAFDDGALIRTHVLRPTWHFVLPEDVRWMLALTAGRVHALNAYYERQSGLDEADHRTCARVLTDRLSGGVHLTRPQVAAALEGAGLRPVDLRLALLLMRAELEGLICSGPRRGRQHTYALLEERVAPAPPIDRADALALLVHRYVDGHGPATVKDLQWWSSLPAADIRGAIEALGDRLVHDEIDGVPCWFTERAAGRAAEGAAAGAAEGAAAGAAEGAAGSGPRVDLVQAYDEYVVGYSRTKYVLDLAGRAEARPAGRTVYNHVLLLDGQVAGHWKRTVTARAVLVEAVLDLPFTAGQHRALVGEVDRHAAFVGRPARLEVTEP